MISPYPLNQFSISNTPRTWKHVKKRKKSIDSRILVSRQFDFTRKSKGKFRLTKNIGFIGEKGRNYQMMWFIMINGPDEASLDQNGAIKSHPSDRRWRAEVCPCRAL